MLIFSSYVLLADKNTNSNVVMLRLSNFVWCSNNFIFELVGLYLRTGTF